MWPVITLFFFHRAVRGALLLGGSNLLLLSGCKQVCEQNLPQYTLSDGMRAWSTPFAAQAVWRFRNPAGYERTYRVISAQTGMESGGGGKSSFCPSFYRERLTADLQRTDSTFTAAASQPHHLQLRGPVGTGLSEDMYLIWQGFAFDLPLEAVEAGQQPLTTATFGGRPHASVLTLLKGQPGSRVLRLYLTKADGVVAFDDQYGTRWARQ